MNSPSKRENRRQIQIAYQLAREQYERLGINTDHALRRLDRIAISMHCWQGDDVSGFEQCGGLSGGGIQVTGNYPGRARNGDELRSDLDKAIRLTPGKSRVNLHSLYAETGGKKVDRNELQPRHFSRWIDWARSKKIGLDFNGSFFSHPLVASGFTLSSADKGIRNFWIEHGISCRKIGKAMGQQLGTPCVTNLWIPDGCKEVPADRKAPRERLAQSLDSIFREPMPKRFMRDAVESKLFGIGSESYVVGSHEFYMGYAIQHKTLLTLDTGHFHPTETVSDKISSVMMYVDGILLHLSRGVRWDSDHVVILSEELLAIANELVRGQYLDRVHLGLDFFDGSVNRIAAWVIGARSVRKAFLSALLEPVILLRQCEHKNNLWMRLGIFEEIKTLPLGAVWDYYCLQNEVPVGQNWLTDVTAYEKAVLSKRR